MTHNELTFRQKILLLDAEHSHSGRQFTFRMGESANKSLDRLISDEQVPAAQLLRVLVREGAKSFLGIDLEAEQQAPAE